MGTGEQSGAGGHTQTHVSMATRKVEFVQFEPMENKRPRLGAKARLCQTTFCLAPATWYVPNRLHTELCGPCKSEVVDLYESALEQVEMGEPEVYRLKDWDRVWQGVNRELLETVQPTPHAHVQL